MIGLKTSRKAFLLSLAFVTITVFESQTAWAVDTVETWDVGATDIDFYTGYDGLGLASSERHLSSDIMLGYGIVQGLSAYLGTAISATEQFTNGLGEVYLGLFGTPLDTDHIDLDLFLDFRLGGTGFTEFQLVPAIELNTDLAPDLEVWGMYFVVGVPIYRQTFLDGAGSEDEEVATSIETTIGTYLTLGERHQILLDYEMAFYPMALAGDSSFEIGSVGLGYNVTVHDSIELITEVRVDIPQAGEAVSVGFVAGLIATLPSNNTGIVGEIADTPQEPQQTATEGSGRDESSPPARRSVSESHVDAGELMSLQAHYRDQPGGGQRPHQRAHPAGCSASIGALSREKHSRP